jgi:hypothetical protein
MNSVDQTKAGVASGILSISRMVGGTFGVAALGALVIALGKSKLGELVPSLSPAARDKLGEALGAGATTGTSARVASAMRESFVYAVQNGLRIGAAVAVVGAVLAATLITVRVHAPHTQAEELAETGVIGDDLAPAELLDEPARA